MVKRLQIILSLVGIFISSQIIAQSVNLNQYNISWNSQSKNAGASMPCGGGDIGLNVWAEKNDVLFYIARSGCFDENNALLKLGRIRLTFKPNPFTNEDFQQELNLKDGSVSISDGEKHSINIHLWVEVKQPIIHVEIKTKKAISVIASYENWRSKDHIVRGKENNENSYKFAPQGTIITHKDHIAFNDNKIIFYHRNQSPTVFDATVKEQGLDSVKNQLFDPLKELTFGGFIQGKNLISDTISEGQYLSTPYTSWALKTKHKSKNIQIQIGLCTGQFTTQAQWKQSLDSLDATISKQNHLTIWNKNKSWWQQFWNRSFILMDSNKNDSNKDVWEAGRNYQLFRYMLACNAYGSYPTKFNGGLFTTDPILVDSSYPFTPDFRNWGGGTFTAQNQRLVYYPMLKSGDFDMMQSEFNFYNNLLKTAEIRTKVYWHHAGACFTEQLENFGLPNPSEYGWKRPLYYDKGMEYNAWLEYLWDTDLEFCNMILETRSYNNANIKKYLPLIKSCLSFFDEHYQYLARKRGRKTLDANGHLILFPGSACETYKMAYNSSSTIAALKTVLRHLLELPDSCFEENEKEKWASMLQRIPPISFRNINGHTTISPAVTWERINNVESPQLYPVFPWGIYGIGKPGLDTARNTWFYDTTVIKNRSYVGWKQDNIFAAKLGLTKAAARLELEKLKSGPNRFPSFWGPGFDWTPDHNWGGSAMIGLQEMLLQTNGKKIYLFPAWPKNWDVHFKLHTTYTTTVEGNLKNGILHNLIVIPQSREADVINMLENRSSIQ